MYANILIPTDGSELAGKAIQHGIALAKRIGADSALCPSAATFCSRLLTMTIVISSRIAPRSSDKVCDDIELVLVPRRIDHHGVRRHGGMARHWVRFSPAGGNGFAP